MRIPCDSVSGCCWAGGIMAIWMVLSPPPQALAWLAPARPPHVSFPSPANHEHKHSSRHSWRRPCSTAGSPEAHHATGTDTPAAASPPQDGVTAGAGDAGAALSRRIPQQATFSVTLPTSTGPVDRRRAITKAATNGLAPLLEGFTAGEGVGLLQVLNSTASLELAAAPTEAATTTSAPAPAAKSAAVALTLRDGNVAWGEGQELWLTLGEGSSTNRSSSSSSSGGGGSPSKNEQQQQQRQRGSARYDFLLLWSAPIGSIGNSGGGGGSWSGSGNPAAWRDSRSIPADQTDAAVDGHGLADRGVGKNGGDGVKEGGGGEDVRQGRGLGLMGGHVVGELRPLNEFSAARQEALDEALEAVGVDPRELTEADEFFGTAALKSYNTFVRPRPKQLQKSGPTSPQPCMATRAICLGSLYHRTPSGHRAPYWHRPPLCSRGPTVPGDAGAGGEGGASHGPPGGFPGPAAQGRSRGVPEKQGREHVRGRKAGARGSSRRPGVGQREIGVQRRIDFQVGGHGESGGSYQLWLHAASRGAWGG